MKSITEEEFYELMYNCMRKKNQHSITYDEIYENWFLCFHYVLKSFNCGFKTKTIRNIFDNFDMSNWLLLHINKTEFRKYTAEEMFNAFYAEANYTADRMSYDRLFRTHWLIKKTMQMV